MHKRENGFQWRSALFPAAYFASNSVYQGYISLYYTHLGFQSAQLGVVSAATAAAALAAQPLWGMLGDRVQSRRRLLRTLSLLAAASIPLALAGKGFALQVAAAMLFYGFFCGLLPLGDAMLLEGGAGGFGGYRLAGGVSFALTAALFGVIKGRLKPGAVVWAVAGLMLFTALAAGGLPDTPGEQKHRRAGVFSLLRNAHLRGMLAFILPLQMTMGFFYTFYAPHFKSLGGGTDGLLGLGYLLSTASEIPYLLMSGRIYERFGAAKPMCAAGLVLGLRWLVLGFAPSAGLALASQLLHGGGFIVITVSMAYWIRDHVPVQLRASGQALLNMVTFGLARLAGNLLGGMLAGSMGRGRAFLVGAGLCAAAVAVFAPRAFAKRD